MSLNADNTDIKYTIKILNLCYLRLLINFIAMKLNSLYIIFAAVLCLIACTRNNEIDGKQIYIPHELQNIDFNNPESKWCYKHSRLTTNLAIFWEDKFGNDPSSAPCLNGNNMTVDIDLLAQKLESFYSFFRDTLHFIREGSKADSLRMMVMLNYSLDGTAYGGDYDQTIGALWVAPNRIQDKQMNCMAHELGHSFQSQIICDKQGKGWGGCGFYEMASQWMLWQVNPNWITDEEYHWKAFCSLTHKAFLHIENIYHSPYVLQYWSDVRGRDVIARLFREGHNGEDALMAYKRIFGLSQREMCDEMFEASRHIVGLDFHHAWCETRRYAGSFSTPVRTSADGWSSPDVACLPENYGFNVIPLDSANWICPARKLTLYFQGLSGQVPAAARAHAGWRYGFVAELSDGTYCYSPVGRESQGRLSYLLPADVHRAWLVVMGAPTMHWRTDTGEAASSVTWPYRYKLQ